jgi:drug/metabolite transporter (DMT)-like permease
MNTPSADRRIHAPGRGIFCLIAGSAAFVINDSIVKTMTDSLPVGQMMSIRGVVSLVIILAICAPRGLKSQLKIYNWKAQISRGILVICAAYSFMTGLVYLPIGDLVAAGFVGPLFLTALAPIFLAERVGWRRWTAVCVGFVGMLIMMRPGGGILNWALMFPIAAAMFGAIRDIMTRRMSAMESSTATLFATTFIVTLGGLLSLPVGWQTPTWEQTGLLVISGVFVCLGQFLTIDAFRYAEAAAISPFKYVSLVWAVAIGFVFWGDIPTLNTIAGATLIIVCGLYILRRERVRR